MKMEALVQGTSITTIAPVHLDTVAISVKINVRNCCIIYLCNNSLFVTFVIFCLSAKDFESDNSERDDSESDQAASVVAGITVAVIAIIVAVVGCCTLIIFCYHKSESDNTLSGNPTGSAAFSFPFIVRLTNS